MTPALISIILGIIETIPKVTELARSFASGGEHDTIQTNTLGLIDSTVALLLKSDDKKAVALAIELQTLRTDVVSQITPGVIDSLFSLFGQIGTWGHSAARTAFEARAVTTADKYRAADAEAAPARFKPSGVTGSLLFLVLGFSTLLSGCAKKPVVYGNETLDVRTEPHLIIYEFPAGARDLRVYKADDGIHYQVGAKWEAPAAATTKTPAAKAGK